MINDILNAYVNPYKLLNPSKIPENDVQYICPISLRQFFYIFENNIIPSLEHILHQIILNPYREYTREIDVGIPDIIDKLRLIKKYKYGDTGLAVYRLENI